MSYLSFATSERNPLIVYVIGNTVLTFCKTVGIISVGNVPPLLVICKIIINMINNLPASLKITVMKCNIVINVTLANTVNKKNMPVFSIVMWSPYTKTISAMIACIIATIAIIKYLLPNQLQPFVGVVNGFITGKTIVSTMAPINNPSDNVKGTKPFP